MGLGLVLVAWYWAGNELMRRRAHRLALWSKRVIDPLGGRQTIRWLGGQAFRIEVEGAQAPFRSLALTGLVESWDVPVVWAWNRLHGRRDMVLMQASLRQQPMWGLEVFRAGTLLTGDARLFARHEGWAEAPLGDLTVAAPGDTPRRLASELVDLIGFERPRLVRLAVRRQDQHLTLALNVADPTTLEASAVSRLAVLLADRVSAS